MVPIHKQPQFSVGLPFNSSMLGQWRMHRDNQCSFFVHIHMNIIAIALSCLYMSLYRKTAHNVSVV